MCSYLFSNIKKEGNFLQTILFIIDVVSAGSHIGNPISDVHVALLAPVCAPRVP